MSYDGKQNGKAMKKKTTSNFQKEQTVEDVLKFPTLAIEDRGIQQRTAQHFGIRTELSSSDGITPVAYYFPYHMDGKVVGFKKRDLTKPKAQEGHFQTIGYQGVKCELFGQSSGNKTGGKKVWITEGEFDAAICWQTLKSKYEKGNPTVLSIGCGTSNAVQHIGQKGNMSYLKKFPEVIIGFDQDCATPQEAKKNIKKGVEATEEYIDAMVNRSIPQLIQRCKDLDLSYNHMRIVFWFDN